MTPQLIIFYPADPATEVMTTVQSKTFTGSSIHLDAYTSGLVFISLSMYGLDYRWCDDYSNGND